MLGNIPKSHIGRQIESHTAIHGRWHESAQKLLQKSKRLRHPRSHPPKCSGPLGTHKVFDNILLRNYGDSERIRSVDVSSSASVRDSSIHRIQHNAAKSFMSPSTTHDDPSPTMDSGLDSELSSHTADSFSIAIVGDLHLEQKGMKTFHRARQQLKDVLSASGSGEPRVVQLGDLGGYSEKPGSMYCFRVADAYLKGFLPIRAAVVTGNHDLEGEEFETDAANLAAWTKTFQQRHYWAMELGQVVCLGISTTRFRSNAFSAHEVYIDEEQMEWFKGALQAAAGRPVIVFSHAPPQGCGLTVIPSVHVKNRCAFLNHSSNAQEFMQLVEQHPNIALWFSGHFHLSHNYMRSISVAGNCAFVQTGVIGDCNRDGYRHTRVMKGDQEGYKLYTMDHKIGNLRLDLEHKWASSQPPQPVLPPSDQLRDDEDEEAWPSSSVAQNGLAGSAHANGGKQKEHFAFERKQLGQQRWMPIGHDRMLSREEGMLVEYDVPSRAAIGAVFLSVGDNERVALIDSQGQCIAVKGPNDLAGAAAVAVERQDRNGDTIMRVDRNAEGGFFQIFQQNKWRLRKQKEAAAVQRQKEWSLL
ncbi:hypothetical protein CVIRNUC_009093 [Coccomyxa viridis]|uniref:Calcineurin-like phosphoesterase domain-containing protein n=1 Tax=Coccomyxa viridis TaxID=1274662 RepID=A0AAV1II38_9CHLO|nr:hypothetical protein CVIRNUC_009093 [Coccomyxa viridis]